MSNFKKAYFEINNYYDDFFIIEDILNKNEFDAEDKYNAWKETSKQAIQIIKEYNPTDKELRDLWKAVKIDLVENYPSKFNSKILEDMEKPDTQGSNVSMQNNSSTTTAVVSTRDNQFTTCGRITIDFEGTRQSKHYETEIKGTYTIIASKNNLYHNSKSKLYLYLDNDNDNNYYILKIRHDRLRYYLQMVALTMNGSMYIARHKSAFKRSIKAMGRMGMKTARAIGREFKETFLTPDVSDINPGDRGQSRSKKTREAIFGGNKKVDDNVDGQLQEKIDIIIKEVEPEIYQVANITQKFGVFKLTTKDFKNMNKFREYDFKMDKDKSKCTITITLSENTQDGGKLNRRTMRRHKKTHRKKQSHNRKTK